MRDLDIDYATLTLSLPKPTGALERVCLALTHQAKNLGNTGLFLVRQACSAYQYNASTKTSQLKPHLHAVQQDVIAHYNHHITLINEKRREKLTGQIEKARANGQAEPKLKLIDELTPSMANPLSSILDATVLDNVARHWPSEHGEPVYKRLPGTMAQQVIASVKDNVSSFFKALKQFITEPGAMTRRPSMPAYQGKHERSVIEIPLAQVHGTLPKLNGKHVPEDYAETSVLPEEVLAVFSGFDVHAMIESACLKRGWKEYHPQHLRIVPLRCGVKMEVVVRVANAYPEQSFLAKLTRNFGAVLAPLKKQKERDAWLLNHLKNLPFDQLPRISAIDLGINNLAAVAYSTGHKAEVHSGGRFDAVLGKMNDAIDQFISSKSTPRAKELQGKKNALKTNNERLPKEEHHELNALLKAAYAEPGYQALAEKKQHWTDNYLHNLSHAMVQQCVHKRIDVIVIGQNKGWKQEIDMGKTQNRRFCQIAHAKLIRFIRYKAQQVGIAVVTVEESYTSQTSFVNNDVLEVFDETKRFDKSMPRPAKSGKRSPSDRNWFAHTTPVNRWNVVHADVNGAFNIIRKVFINFTYHVKLTLKFTLFRLSPRLGVVRL